MEGGLLLNVVVGESSTILELLSGEDESLLVWGNTFLVLDLGLDVVDGVRGLDLEGDRLSREGFDEDLHLCLRIRCPDVTGTERASVGRVGSRERSVGGAGRARRQLCRFFRGAERERG